MTNDRRFVVLIFFGIVIAGSGLFLTTTSAPILGAILINLGVVSSVIAVCRHERRTRTNPHDKLESVCARALPQSWMITLVASNAVFWLDYGGMVPFGGAEASALIAGVMLLSAGVLRASWRRRT